MAITKNKEIEEFISKNKSGLERINEIVETKKFPKEMKLRGTKISNPKKVCLNYYNQIMDKEGGPRQIEAAYRHCCNICMKLEGWTDEQINSHWWKKNKSHGSKN